MTNALKPARDKYALLADRLAANNQFKSANLVRELRGELMTLRRALVPLGFLNHISLDDLDEDHVLLQMGYNKLTVKDVRKASELVNARSEPLSKRSDSAK